MMIMMMMTTMMMMMKTTNRLFGRCVQVRSMRSVDVFQSLNSVKSVGRVRSNKEWIVITDQLRSVDVRSMRSVDAFGRCVPIP